MEEEEDTSPPFWLQNERGRLRRSYSLFLSSGAIVICILVIALAFTMVLVPTLHSFTSNVFKPHSVKKSWDSLNLLLVLFAILCGFLSKNTDETPRSYEDQSFSDTPQEFEKPNPETTPPWYDEYDYSYRMPYKSYNRLRSFKSYPDLREESPWIAAAERWRFYDDTHVNGCRGLDIEENRQRRPVAGEEQEEEGINSIKNIEVDSFVAKEVPTPAPVEKRRSGQSKNRRASPTKEFFTSLKGKKKKLQRHRSVENFQSFPNSEPPTLPSHPPPPPSSAFHNLFSSKKNKQKKLNSASPPRHHVSSMRVSKTEPVHGGAATVKPRLSNKKEDFFAMEANVIAGNDSPLIPIPPPPPPFKMPAWKFRVQGDFVRIDSMNSSSSGSQDLDDDEVVESPSGEDGGEPAILLVYPNPDVDTKADTFIENFRAGLRMEKMNSTREKQWMGRSKSNLGPTSKPRTKGVAEPNRKFFD